MTFPPVKVYLKEFYKDALSASGYEEKVFTKMPCQQLSTTEER